MPGQGRAPEELNKRAAMSSSAAASSYWRVAGMSYLKYANLCADMVRSSLKEPLRTKAKLREAVYYRAAVWKDGKPEKQSARASLPPACLPACTCTCSPPLRPHACGPIQTCSMRLPALAAYTIWLEF